MGHLNKNINDGDSYCVFACIQYDSYNRQMWASMEMSDLLSLPDGGGNTVKRRPLT